VSLLLQQKCHASLMGGLEMGHGLTSAVTTVTVWCQMLLYKVRLNDVTASFICYSDENKTL